MGFFGNMFKRGEDLPELSGDSIAAGQLEAIRANLEKLAGDVSERMEVIPTDEGAYVFIGKPPKRFGIAWIENGEINSIKTLMEEHGVSQQEIMRISDRLRDVYARHHASEHYQMMIAQREIVVTPDASLGEDVRDVLHSLH